MSIVHVVGSGGHITADRTLFVGSRISDEIKSLPKLLKTIDRPTLRKFLQVLVQYFEGNEVSRDSIQELADVLSEEKFAQIYAGLHQLLQAALRLPLNSLKQDLTVICGFPTNLTSCLHLVTILNVFREDLVELKIPTEFIPDITSVVFGSRRGIIDEKSVDRSPRLPRLESFQWRVDVAISTSALNRVLEPTVLVNMGLSDGKVHNFEVPIKKFHELRYNVAKILKDMENLEERSILQID